MTVLPPRKKVRGWEGKGKSIGGGKLEGEGDRKVGIRIPIGLVFVLAFVLAFTFALVLTFALEGMH